MKSSYGPKQASLVYGIKSEKIELDDPERSLILTSRVRWDGTDERSIREAMETPRPERAAGELATRLEEWVTTQGYTVAVKEIAAAFPDVKRATLDQNLARLVHRGKLTRPLRGHTIPPSMLARLREVGFTVD